MSIVFHTDGCLEEVKNNGKFFVTLKGGRVRL